MSELDALGKHLRQELGQPPADWAQQQRRRLRGVSVEPAKSRLSMRMGAAVAFAGVVLLLGYWFGMRSESERPVASTTVDARVWQDVAALSSPYRAPDGSTIQLEKGGRGRFTSNSQAAVFDLHHGRCHFDVTKRPNQNWTVVAGRYEVSVVGTRFSVSYDKHETLGVSVEEGRVRVRVPLRTDPILLEAGDQLTVRENQLKLTARSQSDASPQPATRAEPKAQGKALARNSDGPAAISDGQVGTRPLSPSSRPALGSSDAGDPETGWYTLYQAGRYKEALREAKAQGFPGLTQTLSAGRLVALADTARLGGDSNAALTALRALEARFPGSAAAQDAGFLIGRLHAQRGQAAPAIRRLNAYLQRGDSARYSLEAMGRLMELYAAAGNAAAARPIATRYLQRAPSGPYQRLAKSILEQK